MRCEQLGSSGLRISRICLGMMSYGDRNTRAWHLDETAAEPIVRRAVEAGVTFFDTADMYSGGASEELTGRLLAKMFRQRQDFVLATKVFYPTGTGPNDCGLSRKHIMASIDESLRRLGTEYIDLYQIHRWDPITPIEETMSTLDDLVRIGKVRYLGASSMYAWQFSKAQHVAERNRQHRFISMQHHYNLLYREEEREMIPLCNDQGVGLLPWSPLARGLLARPRLTDGNRTVRSTSDPLADDLYATADTGIIDAVTSIALERQVPNAQIALAWLLSKQGVAATIVGATKSHHIDDAVAATEITLTIDEIEQLEAPYKPRPVQAMS
jgi:aryl-alcohol dehydrogenase-like predicted oxidoreductase